MFLNGMAFDQPSDRLLDLDPDSQIDENQFTLEPTLQDRRGDVGEIPRRDRSGEP